MPTATPPPALSPAQAPGEAADWLQRWAHLLPAHTAVLDIACGRGRHLRWLAALINLPVREAAIVRPAPQPA